MREKALSLQLASNLDELEKLDPFVKKLCSTMGCDSDKEHLIMLVLTEAVTNAILHGNKENPEKSVEIVAEMSPNVLKISIRDEGSGFDPDKIPNPLDRDNLLKSSGRGVWLMREFADKVEFKEGGRTVVLQFRF